MVNFISDYNNGMHPAVLEAFVKTNGELSLTYGADKWTASAQEKIRKACNCPEARVFFLVGGTQTNATVIHSLMHSYQGIVAVDTGHINVHEAGAIERTGHKVITLPNHGGRMSPTDLESYLSTFFADENYEHAVIPGMVYITFPTELGSLYTKEDIAELYSVCKKHNLVFYIDGARLGYGMMAEGSNVDLPWIAEHCDVFYIGGTKVGAICGEAVVFTKNNTPKHFFSYIKQQGALLAKGRLGGIQFDTLFTDDLYFKIGKYADNLAMQLKKILLDKGYALAYDSPTNQQFPIIPNDKIAQLKKEAIFDVWGPYDDNSSVCRFVTSWATTQEDIKALADLL